MTDPHVSKSLMSPLNMALHGLKLHISNKDEYMDMLHHPLDNCTSTALGHKIHRGIAGRSEYPYTREQCSSSNSNTSFPISL